MQKILFYISASLCLTNCTHKKYNTQWSAAEIKADIIYNPVYKELVLQPELYSVFELEDSSSKRTSDVAYFRDYKVNQNGKYSKINNCRAYILLSGTLSIDIGIGKGFGGQGFIVKYKNRRFNTEPYYFTDLIIEGEVKPTYEIVYQKLILDKPSYTMGDSLYGYIEFKSIETDNQKHTSEHFGKGYFRSIIKAQ